VKIYILENGRKKSGDIPRPTILKQRGKRRLNFRGKKEEMASASLQTSLLIREVGRRF